MTAPHVGEPVPFGPFRLLRRIAVGGTSEVFLAEAAEGKDPLAEPVVVKRLLPMLLGDANALRTFDTEARLHRAIRHPHVVEVISAGVADGEPYLAMKYVDGVDLFRLWRRASNEGRMIPIDLAAYICRSVADALACTHAAKDETGARLVVAHRDVTPSNVYLSRTGDVLLGDFGIAKAATARASRASLQAGAIKGKYGYLAPEQVGAEESDHRADLFSLGVVLAELVLGKPLFSATGQLAVLLAIRDARTDAIDEISGTLPPAFYALLKKTLAKTPEERVQTAEELSRGLHAFEGSEAASRRTLAEWVAWASDTSTIAARIRGALRDSVDKHPPVVPLGDDDEAPTNPRFGTDEHLTLPRKLPDDDAPPTIRFDEKPSAVRLADGSDLGRLPFAEIVARIVTGALSAEDEVSLLGEPFRKVGEIDLLARHLPDDRTTKTLSAPQDPDESWDLAETSTLAVLGLLARRGESGFLMIVGPKSAGAPRREVYLKGGLLHHVGASDTSELLGQALVRRGILSSEELDMALAVLPKFGGRLGDTLVSLGLVDAVELFRAIEEQGKDRLVRAFPWTEGHASFYRGVAPKRLEFPLAEDMSGVLLMGAAAAMPGDAAVKKWRARLDLMLRRAKREGVPRKNVPKPLVLLLDTIGQGMTLRQVLLRLGTSGAMEAEDALRTLEVALALGLVEAT